MKELVVFAFPEFRPRPKFDYVRDIRIRNVCRALACQHCGRSDGGVTWAHSNSAEHGKGFQIKASDQYVAALCRTCHHAVDFSSHLTQAQRLAIWFKAHVTTAAALFKAGVWPAHCPLPT